MPYAIVGISVITALLPRMSAHASERRFSEVKLDFSGGVRLSSAVVVPGLAVPARAGRAVRRGAVRVRPAPRPADAKYIGLVFGIFSLGLVPYMMFQLMLRVFYAMHDSRTPMYIGVAVMAVNVVVSLFSLAALPAGHVVEGVAAAFGLANLVGTVIAWRILSRRMRGLHGRLIAISLVRMHLAAIPGAIFALAVSFAVGVIFAPGPAFGIITVIIGGSGALLLYVLFAQGARGHRTDRTGQRAADEAGAMSGPAAPGGRAAAESPTGNGLHGRRARASARWCPRPTMVTAAW